MGRKSERTKDVIADALLQVLLDDSNTAVTVKAVSERAGVDRQTFYYHFPNIEGATLFLSQREGRALLADLPKSISFKEDVNILLDRIEGRKPVLRAIAMRLGYPLLASMLKERARDLIDARIDWQLSRSDTRANVNSVQRYADVARYCSLATAAALEEWIVGETTQDKGDLANFLIDGFTQQMTGFESTWTNQ